MRTTRTPRSRANDAAYGMRGNVERAQDARMSDVVRRDIPDVVPNAIAPPSAAVRRDALLAKMAADRARLRLNLAREHSQYSDYSPGKQARLLNSDAMQSSESEYEFSRARSSQFISDHALSVTATVLGLLVLGPRKAVFAVLRNLAPLLLARGVRMLFDQHDRSIADASESADRRSNARSSMRSGAAGEPDSVGSLHAVSEVLPSRGAGAARFAAGADSKRNSH